MLVKRLIRNSNIELELQDKVTGCDIVVILWYRRYRVWECVEIFVWNWWANIRWIREQIIGSRKSWYNLQQKENCSLYY